MHAFSDSRHCGRGGWKTLGLRLNKRQNFPASLLPSLSIYRRDRLPEPRLLRSRGRSMETKPGSVYSRLSVEL